ncbi:TLDc domain-containing protein [Entamoeba marina]
MERLSDNCIYNTFRSIIPKVNHILKEEGTTTSITSLLGYESDLYDKNLGRTTRVIEDVGRVCAQIQDAIVKKVNAISTGKDAMKKLQEICEQLQSLVIKEETAVDALEKRLLRVSKTKELPACEFSKNEFDSNQALEVLKSWSGLNFSHVLYDSDLHGDGRGSLHQTLMDKSKLFFLHFDNNDNVFGGYVQSKITELNTFNYDKDCFVFSLRKNGVDNPRRYLIKETSARYAFHLNSAYGMLYQFGNDIRICKVGDARSCCYQFNFEYDGTEDALSDRQWNRNERFSVERIIIMQMC